MDHVRRIRRDEGPILKSMRLTALREAPDAFTQTLAAVMWKTDADWAADAARWSTASTNACFLAEHDSEIVAMGGVFVADGHGELVAMWTRPDTRRRGVARQIIDAVTTWCRDAALSELRTGSSERCCCWSHRRTQRARERRGRHHRPTHATPSLAARDRSPRRPNAR